MRRMTDYGILLARPELRLRLEFSIDLDGLTARKVCLPHGGSTFCRTHKPQSAQA